MSHAAQDDDDSPPGGHAAKAEGWVVTFADMMSLLMSFFVLMLSFSEQDSAKFKEVGGSLERAFGVQREIVSYEIPKGTSIVAKEFSPGKPSPTVLNEVRQKTTDENKLTLDFDEKRIPMQGAEGRDVSQGGREKGISSQEMAAIQKSKEQKRIEITETLAKTLAKEIMQGLIEIEAKDQRIVIRVLEQGSFADGDDTIQPSFIPILNKISTFLDLVPGEIDIAGHTDDTPVSNRQYRSNWDLSAGRAIAVARYLTEDRDVNKNRIVILGYGDARPLYPNDTKENRLRNRRVEITLIQGDNPSYEPANFPVDADKVKKQVREIYVNPSTKNAQDKPVNVE
ncbi:MotB family protein [Candidatus Berkiella aquae]|uniref:Motility protein B n=1 Tax=Candidatus Berkiella aquae TaxID=295108 RepID=A0A0Q9YMH1_9GAMM|nr:MotB family protein [Candidatus Berkiella aquae]MCS5710348.1 OmpA family protein [Candidatus Berkiella aquae]